MIWEHIPKTSYVSLSQLQLGVFDVVANFSDGRRASILIYDFMNITPGKYTLLECNRISKARLQASKYDSSEPIKKRRKIRLRKTKLKDDKNEQKDGESNEAGPFQCQ